MNMPELLAPAGSFEGVRAAVQSGATAVYMGFGTFNARRGAKNFTKEEMRQAISYCRARGVKTNITFNILALDKERQDAINDIKFLNEAGADALIVQDLGVAKLIKECAPDMPIHASTQMTIHTLDGALIAKELGFSRVVLSRECTLEQIKYITANAGIETEVFVHGALCMCYSGQCYLSAVIGQRSGNRGLCAQPCRLPYKYDGCKKQCYPLSLKDLSLAGWLEPIVKAGVSSLKIEGRMKRPEYAAIVTDIYAKLLKEKRRPTAEEVKTLELVFSRDGFTDGYLTGKKGDNMFGTKTDVPLESVKHLYDEAAKRFAEGKEMPLVPINMVCDITQNGISLTVTDLDGNMHNIRDNEPIEMAKNKPTSSEQLEKNLRKTGGTPFDVKNISVNMPDGVIVPASRINAIRRQALESLLETRGKPPVRRWIEPKPLEKSKQNIIDMQFVAMVRTIEQAQAVKNSGIRVIYAPLEVAAKAQGLIPIMPRVYRDDEQASIEKLLETCKNNGINSVMITNIGQVELARKLNLKIHGDFGLNVYNSSCMHVLNDLGIERQVLSFEARLAQLRDLQKPIDTILTVYGYLPLMVFENCAIRRKTGECTCKKQICYLTDRQGKKFALLPAFGCRNELLNSQPLYIADKINECKQVGAKYAMLRFTIEDKQKCAEICSLAQNNQSINSEFTRGLYYRGVE